MPMHLKMFTMFSTSSNLNLELYNHWELKIQSQYYLVKKHLESVRWLKEADIATQEYIYIYIYYYTQGEHATQSCMHDYLVTFYILLNSTS